MPSMLGVGQTTNGWLSRTIGERQWTSSRLLQCLQRHDPQQLVTMPTPDPTSYANEWVRAWNAHDVEAVLDHFHDDVVFTNLSSAEAWPFTSARKSIPWVRPGYRVAFSRAGSAV
jgi:hypothetical protein